MRSYPHPAAEPVVRALADELESAGVRVLDMRACSRVGLLLIGCDLVVWCYGSLVRWRQDGREVTWPAADVYGAARRLAAVAEGGTSRP